MEIDLGIKKQQLVFTRAQNFAYGEHPLDQTAICSYGFLWKPAVLLAPNVLWVDPFPGVSTWIHDRLVQKKETKYIFYRITSLPHNNAFKNQEKKNKHLRSCVRLPNMIH